MKHLSYLAFFALLLSGCGNLYGPYNAPVVDRNVRYGQPPVRDINQPQQPRVVSQRVISSQVVRQSSFRQAPVPVSVVGQTQIAQGSHYRPAPVPIHPTPAPQANNDGWNSRQPTGTFADQPKVVRPISAIPATPVIRKPVEQEALVDGLKITPTVKREEVTQVQDTTRAVDVLPDEPKIAKKPEPAPEPEKPKRPAPLRPKAYNEAEDAVVEKVSPSQNRPEEVATRVPTPAAPASGKTAVSSLLKKAASSLNKGRLDEAVAYLENAQRIEPNNSKILYDIANIRYHQGRYRDAENFAGKASQLSSGSMSKKSWRLISKAREALGDKQGALQAAERGAQ